MAQDEQITLLPEPTTVRVGRTSAEPVEAKSILTPASGFMADWDYTLNPYSGCGYGCNYCYAAFFSRDTKLQETWGEWVRYKHNAVDLIRRDIRRLDKRGEKLQGKTIYMSTVTDPYQLVEHELELTRDVLKELVDHQPWLTIQTRGPLVTRDIDLLKKFEVVQVNMTVTTDSDDVRRAFEPLCQSNNRRLEAITEVAAAGLDAAITMTPLLPVEDAEQFAADLKATSVKRFVVQEFHTNKGRFVRGTRADAVEMAKAMNWTPERYQEVVAVLEATLPHLAHGQSGFAPPRTEAQS